MAVTSRANRTVKIITPTKGQDEGGSLELTDVVTVASYRCQIEPMTPKNKQLSETMFGLEVTGDMWFGFGAYKATLVPTGTIQKFVKDETNQQRWQIVAANSAKGFSSTPHHSYFVCKEVPYE